MDLRNVEVFVEVVRNASFSKAAQVLKLPNSHVSRRIKELELDLGVILIDRSTRKFSITDVGEQYFHICQEGLGRIVAANDFVESLKGEPQGTLNIVAPNELATFLSVNFINHFIEKFPKISLNVKQIDKATPADYSQYDVVIEVGVTFAPLTFRQRVLTNMKREIYASPAYLKSQKKQLNHPQDINSDDLVGLYSQRGEISATDTVFEHSKTGEKFKVKRNSRLNLSNLTSVKNIALNGKHIAAIPRFVAEDRLKSGELKRILSAWSTLEIPILAVFDKNRAANPKVKAFINELSVFFKSAQ